MMIDQEKLKQAQEFYNERILGWMINDLKRSIVAKTNFLTALGCLIYTEIIGIFLPPLKKESGTVKEKRFYRCLFRLQSHIALRELDTLLRMGTNNHGLYAHLRHSMTHKYYPIVEKKAKNLYLTITSIVARDGITKDKKEKAPPIFLSDKGSVVIATRNYTNELEMAVNDFIDITFCQKDPEFQRAAIDGIDVVLRGKS